MEETALEIFMHRLYCMEEEIKALCDVSVEAAVDTVGRSWTLAVVREMTLLLTPINDGMLPTSLEGGT